MMNVLEIADYLKISENSIYKLAKKGKIPCRKKEGRWLFDKEEIDSWLQGYKEDIANKDEQSKTDAKKLINSFDFKNQTVVQKVKEVKLYHPLKEVHFYKGSIPLILPRSAWVTKGDYVEINNDQAFVICKNGKSKIFPYYLAHEQLSIGNLTLELLIKEITEKEEFESYNLLTDFHYRGRQLYGRTSPLIIRNFHPIYPKVIGYIELTSAFYMNKPRNVILNASFQSNEISWELWDSETRRRYIHLIARIARCVVYPEFRGLGLGQILIKHAIEFARERWQIAETKPYFLEISADMLKFVPFAEKAGMVYIGETEGNLKRVAKDMAYLLRNRERVLAGEIVNTEDASGIIDSQITRMKRALLLMQQENWSQEELIAKLEKLSTTSVLKDFNLFHDIVRLPKPTFLQGLTPEAEAFIEKRATELAIEKNNTPFSIKLDPIKQPIVFEGVSLTYQSYVRRTQKTHAIQQAFSISPDDISHKVVRNFNIELNPGEVILLTGPSGCGKTTLLHLLSQKEHTGLEGSISWPNNYRPGVFAPIRSQKALIEVFGKIDIKLALQLMGIVGLSDALIYLKRFDELSNGQQYRTQLAQLIIENCNVWLADEFCANLDSVTANVVAARLQKIARQLQAVLVVASSQPEVFMTALNPDRVIHLTTAWEHQVISGSEFIHLFPSHNRTFSPSTLSLSAEYLSAIRLGRKSTTIRKGRLKVSQGMLLLTAKEDFVIVQIKSSRITHFKSLTEEDAKKDGFENLEQLHQALKKHYSKLTPNSWLTIIYFENKFTIQ